MSFPYLTSHLLQCDYCTCAHCSVDVETIYRAAVVKYGLRLWSWLDVVPNSQKQHCRTFNLRPTALVDIPAVSMPIARSLKICDISGIVLCNKTAHLCYCDQPKAHLCNNHYNQHPDMLYLSGGWIILVKQNCSLTDLNKFVNKIWEKYSCCVCRKSVRFFYFNSWKMGAKTKVLRLYFVQYTILPATNSSKIDEMLPFLSDVSSLIFGIAMYG